MTLALTLALLMIAQSLAAQPTGSTEKFGGGAKRLLMGALRHASNNGYPDLCLNGIEVEVNIGAGAVVPGRESSFTYLLGSPAHNSAVNIQVFDPIGVPAHDPFTTDTYGQYEVRTPNPGTRACISELRIDSGTALAAALKHGLPGGTDRAYDLLLTSALDKNSDGWRDKRLRGKVYWVATLDREDIGKEDKTLPAWFIDASNGRLLKTGTR